MPMSDGMILRAEIWLPEVQGPWPAVLVRTPYAKEGPTTTAPQFDARLATSRGYAVVLQDVRGTGTSDGTFTPFVDEEADGADSVAWVAGQEWCNGDVVMAGVSYVGATQWLAAAARPPALKAIAPGISSDEYGEGWSLTAGVPEHGFMSTLSVTMFVALEDRMFDAPEGALDDVEHLNQIAPWTEDWYSAPPESPVWTRISAAQRRAEIEVPALISSGWYDIFLAGTIGSWERSCNPLDQLVIGPWGHDPYLSYLVGDINTGIAGAGAVLFPWVVDFYDAILSEREPDSPRARAYALNARRWLGFDAWPPPSATATAIPLEEAAAFAVDPDDPVPSRGGRGLLVGTPDAGWGVRDQRPNLDRDDVVIAGGATLEAATLLAGPVTAVLNTGADGDGDCLWVATLCVEQDDGPLHNICDGVASAPPGSTRVDVSLGHACIELPAGSRLFLLVAGSSFPRWPRPGSAHTQSLDSGGELRLTVAPHEALDANALA